MGSAAFEAIKSTSDLPSPTGVALQILRLAQDERCTVEQIADAVASDPALSGRLLKHVNSPLAGIPRDIASIPHAVSLLGIRPVTNLALGFSLVSNNRKGACGGFDYDRFWSESLGRAVALRRIEESRDDGLVVEAFVCGLLSLVGRLAFATAYPEQYGELIAGTEPGDLQALREIERARWKLDHNELASEMLRDWQLPNFLCDAVLQQNDPDRVNNETGSSSVALARSLRLAGAIAEVLTSPSVTPHVLTRAECVARGLGISRESYEDLFDATASEWNETGAVFSIPTRSQQSLESIYVQARACQEKLQSEKRNATKVSTGGSKVVEPDTALPAILIVDDDPTSLLLLERHLAKVGFPVRTASGGEEAVKILTADGPPIVITDWQMPGMDGLELCKTIRNHDGIAFAFVMVTGHESSEERLVEAFGAGADDYLSKPIKPRELLARLRAGVRIVTLQKELDSRNREVHRYNAEMEVGNARLARANQELNRMATTDELTGLINRREAMVRLSAAWADAERHNEDLAVIALDIDRFNSCNDVYGHAAGDAILKETAEVLRQTARQEEAVCRIGGEEFLVICPRSDEAMAAVAAERLRVAVEANCISHGGLDLEVTVSLGVAQRTPEMQRPDDLLRAGDSALYAAKDGGRNMVCCSGEAEASTDVQDPRGEAVVRNTLFPEVCEDRTGLVLIVDDDASHHRLCEKYLTNEGYTVQHATTAEQAMTALERDGVALVIINAVLPGGGSGVDCARAIKSNPVTAGCPVILTGVRGEALDVVTGRDSVADEYLGKPVDPRELIVRVRGMLRLGREMARSHEVRGEQSRAFDLLVRFSTDIAVASTLNQVLQLTVHVLAELSGSQGVVVYLLDEHDPTRREAMSIGRCGDAVDSRSEPIRTAAPDDRLGLNGDEGGDSDGPVRDDQLLIIPLLAPDVKVGEIHLSRRLDAAAFTTIDKEYLHILCNMAAASIHERLTQQARDDARDSIVIALAKLAEHRDTDTGKHLDRVARFSAVLAQELRKQDGRYDVINDDFIDDLRRAVPLHDIGKVAVPDHILLKPGPLTEEEWVVMRTHTTVGAQTIRSVLDRAPGTSFLTMAEQIARAHHEWFNGAGYPNGLCGDTIPLAARITSVADAYDAITTTRPYKDPVPHQRAIAIITEAAGTQFDPSITAALLVVESDFKTLGAELADDVCGTDSEEPSGDAAPKLAASVIP